MTRTSSRRSIGSTWWRQTAHGRRLGLAFEAVSVLSIFTAGVWFVVTGLGDSTNAGAIAGFAVLGLLGTLLLLPFAVQGRHWAAAAAALISVVTPTGFAYVPNLLMIAVVIIEARLAVLNRSSVAA